MFINIYSICICEVFVFVLLFGCYFVIIEELKGKDTNNMSLKYDAYNTVVIFFFLSID